MVGIALAKRRMIGFGNDGVGAAIGEARGQHEGVGDEAAHRIAGGGKLRGLRDAVAEHEVRAKGLPQPALAQHRFGGATVRRHFGIGNGEAAGPAGLDQPSEALEPFVDCQRRAPGREDDELAHGVHGPGIARQARGGQLIRKVLVGRQEHLERRAVLDLPRQGSRGAEYELHVRVLGPLELAGDLGEREVEIGRRGDRGRPLSGPRRRHHEQQTEREHAAEPVPEGPGPGRRVHTTSK